MTLSHESLGRGDLLTGKVAITSMLYQGQWKESNLTPPCIILKRVKINCNQKYPGHGRIPLTINQTVFFQFEGDKSLKGRNKHVKKFRGLEEKKICFERSKMHISFFIMIKTFRDPFIPSLQKFYPQD